MIVRARVSAILLLAGCATSALALPPDQIYERVAPAVWSVKAYTAEEKLLASASSVVIAPGKLVTSCQVLARARLVQLRRGNTIFEAKLEYPDVERDLCQLEAPGLNAPAPAVGSARTLKPGQRLYVVGFARGNEQPIGEGLVSVVSEAGSNKERIQTTVPASPGLMGAGVFDEEARLVGIVTSSPKDAAASAFALPADWLAELAERGKEALASRSKPAASAAASAAAPGLPTVGTQWVYGVNDQHYGKRLPDLTVRVLRVGSMMVEEAVTSVQADGQGSTRAVNIRDARFFATRLPGDMAAVEFAPYLAAAHDGKVPAQVDAPAGYPLGGGGLPRWIISYSFVGWETVSVSAGTFKAARVELRGKRERDTFTNASHSQKFEMVAWYAPAAGRFVRLEHRTYSGALGTRGALMGHDVIELLKYLPGR